MDCEYFGLVPEEGDPNKWVWLECRTCGTQLCAQKIPPRGWMYKWRDVFSRFHGIWGAPSCEEVLLRIVAPVMES